MQARWQRLSDVYDGALALAPAARASFLDGACGDDPTLRADVESLLRHGLPSTPAIEAMAAVLGRSRVLPVGSRLGPYRIDALIGEGGMGQVYRARDLQLQRDVAIKVLPPVFALDPNRRSRFEREARLLASLNHVHIGAIYGLAEGEGLQGLVLELVDGDTLADRLRSAARKAKAGIPLQEALRFARQIAEALDAAHGQGIIHRDLKPANIKVTSTGTIKVLDFGLAKMAGAGDDVVVAPDELVTRSDDTRAGSIIGTAAYMSPEQAQGQPVDKRADIWAYGCVCYEMLTGRSPFARETVAQTLSAVSNEPPDFSALPQSAPRVTQLVRHCLEKDPRRRLRDIGDALFALEDSANGAADPAGPSLPAASRTGWRVAGIVSIVAAAAVLAWMLKPSPPAPARPFAVRIAAPTTDGVPRGLALSPDGTMVAYVVDGGSRSLCVTSTRTEETRCLDGTARASYPFFSPDGQWIAFFAGGQLKKVLVDGGKVIPIADTSAVEAEGTSGSGGAWGRDGTIFYAWRGGIWKVSDDSGVPVQVTSVDRQNGEIYHQMPILLPDGRTLLYSVWKGPGWDERELFGYRMDTREKRLVLKGAGLTRYASTGHLVYTSEGRVWAVRFDPSQLKVIGAPVDMPETVRERTIYAQFDLAADGSLAYEYQHPDTSKRTPVLVDGSGNPEPLPGVNPAYYQAPTFSPDGRKLAMMVTRGLIDIVIYDFDRRTVEQLTSEGSSQYPVWSKDGHLYYRGTRSGRRNIFRRPLDLASAEEPVTSGDAIHLPWSISDDGLLFYDESGQGVGSNAWMLSVNGDRKPGPLFPDPAFHGTTPKISPDRQWLAFTSGGAVYVQRFPDGTHRRQIFRGSDPVWSRFSNELFFLNGRTLMKVTRRPGADPFGSAPLPAFDMRNYVLGGPGHKYDVHPDGVRFVMLQPMRDDQPSPYIEFAPNWLETLKDRLPAD